MKSYIIYSQNLSASDAFAEASREELRVLLALIGCGGKIEDAKQLSELAKTSKARASSALVYWEEAEIIQPTEKEAQTITEEFEERLMAGKIREVSSASAAQSIRNFALCDMINECATLMQRAALNTSEIKEITALYEQYGLSEEYILTLAAYLAEQGRLTVTKLVNKAIKLTEKEIDTPKELEAYIVERESDSEVEREFRKLFNAYNRAPSKTEKECFKKWSKDFGYFTDIVGEAYDIAATSVTRGHLKYTDKLLTRWYEAGCRTLADCRRVYEADKAERKAQRESEKAATQKPAKKKERFGDFDPEEAFRLALERSYGASDTEGEA
jgi:DnaD/phage-associated family protein